MGQFDGFLLVSDFDGTLIGDDRRISDGNIAAIETFIAEGGHFLGATGRTEVNVRPYTQGIRLSSPWILYNGAAIFDWDENTFVYKALLDRPLTETFIRMVMTHFPAMNIQDYPGGPFCQINGNGAADSTAIHEQQPYHDKPMDKITADWLKVLFCSDDPSEINAVEAMLLDHPLRLKTHQTRSGPRYFELTALGANKGSALAKLKDLLQPRPHTVIAIGDYLNDIEMLIEADIAAAPESALWEVRSRAQIITSSHNHSAIADLLRQLRERLSCSDDSGG